MVFNPRSGAVRRRTQVAGGASAGEIEGVVAPAASRPALGAGTSLVGVWL